MIDLTIHPDYVPRSTTRAEWKAKYRDYRLGRRWDRETADHMLDALAYAFCPEHVRQKIIDRMVYEPVIVAMDFGKDPSVSVIGPEKIYR